MSSNPQTYSKVAIILHWLIALMIISLVLFGWLMTKEWMPNRFTIYQWHKSFGIIVLLLSICRLVWRILNPPPALPDHMKNWEKLASKITHIGFYILMIGVPLMGWAMISASTLPIENELFYIIPLPDLPGISPSKGLEMQLKEFHEIGAKLILVLFVLHVGAALKHHFITKDNVLSRMIPALKKRG